MDKVIGALVKLAMCPGVRDGSEHCAKCSYRAAGVKCYSALRSDCNLVLAKHDTRVVTTPDKPCDEAIDLKKRVTAVMHYLGAPAHLIGYDYMRYAIILTVEDKSVVRSMTKVLYPSIAKEFGTTPSRAERAIRHIIETMWSRCDIDVLCDIFGYTVSSGKGKPTNSEFISLVAENISLGKFDHLS